MITFKMCLRTLFSLISISAGKLRCYIEVIGNRDAHFAMWRVISIKTKMSLRTLKYLTLLLTRQIISLRRSDRVNKCGMEIRKQPGFLRKPTRITVISVNKILT